VYGCSPGGVSPRRRAPPRRPPPPPLTPPAQVASLSNSKISTYFPLDRFNKFVSRLREPCLSCRASCRCVNNPLMGLSRANPIVPLPTRMVVSAVRWFAVHRFEGLGLFRTPRCSKKPFESSPPPPPPSPLLRFRACHAPNDGYARSAAQKARDLSVWFRGGPDPRPCPENPGSVSTEEASVVL
jgi:hypothetical protein